MALILKSQARLILLFSLYMMNLFCFHNFYQIGNRRELPYRLFITEQCIPYTGLTGETFTSFVPAVYIGEYVACQLASNQVRDKKGI